MSLFGSMQVSASGMAAQRTRAEMLVENMANSETTHTPEGGPYKRKDVVFSSEPQTSPFSAVFQNEVGEGVTVSDITEDQSAPQMRYMPGHPDANAKGYVAFPNMNPAEDMVDLLSATRSYEANVAAIASVKDMISRSIDIMRT
ncbi:MAG TPA: flagellar basal body rod protein FlgC [Bryobacteraceae bacterium]|nr:flagellar basal body rod protein FlgC [Bryobacteraceae bacterium]